MWLFAAGCMFGGIIGVFGVALCVAARRGDDMATEPVLTLTRDEAELVLALVQIGDDDDLTTEAWHQLRKPGGLIDRCADWLIAAVHHDGERKAVRV